MFLKIRKARYDDEGNVLWIRAIKPFMGGWNAKESPGGYIIAVGRWESEEFQWPIYVGGLILKMDLNGRTGDGCVSHSYYFKEVSANVSFKDFEINLEDFDKSKIRKATNYEISKKSKGSDSEYLCYTGCIKTAVCTDDFPPQCTIEKKCNE